MNDLILFLVKGYLAGCLFLGFYQLVMRRESFFRFNRVYLLTSALMMVVLPLMGSVVPLNLVIPDPNAPIATFMLPEVVITGERMMTMQQEQTLINWVTLGYLAITLAMLGGLVYSVIRIVRFYRATRDASLLEKNIYVIPGSGSPFSFLGRIFISHQYVNHPGLKSIVVHENAHLQQMHIVDLILIEFLSSVFWFNPFFFLIKRALREVHEYLADQEVILQGTETLEYQQLLYNEVSGNPQYIVANNFNLLTKKRIIMLLKKSGKYAVVRIGMLMPFLLAAILLISLLQSNHTLAQQPKSTVKPKASTATAPAKQEAKATTPKSQVKYVAPVVLDKNENPKKVKEGKGEEVFTVVENMPQYPGGQEAMMKFLVESIKYPKSAVEKGIQGVVYVSFVVEKNGVISGVKVLRGFNSDCDAEAVRVVKLMPDWKPGTQSGKAVRVQFTMPIKFALDEKKPAEAK